MVAGLQLTLEEQCDMVLEAAGIEHDIVTAPPLYLTVHTYSIEDADAARIILNLRDDLQYWRARSFLDGSYVLLYIVRKLGFERA